MTGTANEFTVLRQRTGLAIGELAPVLGVSERTVKRWDTGETTPKPPVIMALTQLVRQRDKGADGASASFRFIDLFAGIGGLRRGFDAIGGKCVFTSEWNRYAVETYRANYHDGDEHAFAGDITAVHEADIPDHDVLLAGFPCQPFSIAGVSKKNALGRA